MDATCPNCDNALHLGVAEFTEGGKLGELSFPQDVRRIDSWGFGSCHHCLTVLIVKDNVVRSATHDELLGLSAAERVTIANILNLLEKGEDHAKWMAKRAQTIMEAVADTLDKLKVRTAEAALPLTGLLVRALKSASPVVRDSVMFAVATACGFEDTGSAAPEEN